MIRTSKHILKYSTKNKDNVLDLVYNEYRKVVQGIIDVLWKEHINYGSFVSKDILENIDTWISKRLMQCAGKQALQVVKSCRKKDRNLTYKLYKLVYRRAKEKNKTWLFLNQKWSKWSKEKIFRHRIDKPFFDGNMELDNRFIDIQENLNSFDLWIKIGSIGNKIKINIPTRKHKHFNKLKNDKFKLKKSCRISKINNNFYINFYHEKKESVISGYKELGIDVGINKLMTTSNNEKLGTNIKKLINKLNNRKQKSKNWFQTLNEIKNYIGESVNKIDFMNNNLIVLENLKNITKNTKKRTNKNLRRQLGYWNLNLLTERIKNKCEENGVSLQFVSPLYTSQKCSSCGEIHKESRNGEKYICKCCGLDIDADYNASLNILNLFKNEEFIVPHEQKELIHDFSS